MRNFQLLRFVVGILLAIILLFSVGCSNSKSNSVSKTDNNQKNEVVVYSPHGGDERGKFIVQKAKEQIGLDVKFLSAGGGTLADRLLAEKNNPQADVTMALNSLFLIKLKREGVLSPFKPSWADGLPEKYKDKDNFYFGFGRTPIVMAYNSKYISEENAPKTWLDLVKPEYKNKFALSPLENQTTRMYLAGMLWRFYEKDKNVLDKDGWEFLKNLYQNAKVVDNSSFSWTDVANGKTPIVLNWLGGIKKDAKNNNVEMKYVDSDGGTPIVAESIALIKGGKNADNSKKFIEWFGSPKFMAEYAEAYFHFGQVPLHPKAVELCRDEIKQESKLFKEQDIDLEIVSKELDKWIEKIELEILP